MDNNLIQTNNNNWWLSLSDHLGGIYPFYDEDEPDYFTLDIGNIISRRKERGAPVELDVAAVVCKVTKPYLLGNRTLVTGVRRVPWMSKFSPDKKIWTPVELPPHGYSRPNPPIFTSQLKSALLREISEYIGDARSVGILLSGGMDSRVVAGVLREHQLANGKSIRVTTITWGNNQSRDVIYARRIADRFGWEVQQLPLNSQTLLENIELAGLAGAEVSAFHLHAMPKVSELQGVDLVLAGSYGDSVGRAEFSGRKVTKLKSVLSGRIDPFGVVRQSVVRDTTPTLRDDCSSPHLPSTVDQLRQYEIEQEMHYMRRMLQACMLTIAKNIPLYQMFTAPEVFGLMWGLDPAVRDNSWYRYLLEQLPGNLLDIPWSRSGLLYDQPDSRIPDQYSSRNNSYGQWLRADLRETIIDRANSSVIRSLGLFNDMGLDRALKSWGKATTNSTNSLDELFCWLASLHVFLKHYDIEVETIPHNFDFRDMISSIRGGLYAELLIQSRNIFRK